MSYLARLPLALAAALAACGPSVSGGDDDDDNRPIDAALGDGGLPGDGGEQELPSRVYAHSGTMLYRVDTTTFVATPIGAFTNLDSNQSVLDLAVDRDERMIGVTSSKIYEINETNAQMTQLAIYTGESINSLSFVPANAGDPDGLEMLVAATRTGDVVRIDIANNTATPFVIGNYGQHLGEDVVSSGDIVYVKGFGTVATVDVGTTPGTLDSLARIDPANNWRATVLGSTGTDKIFGLAYWSGRLYGFADTGATTGAFLRIDTQTGSGSLLQAGAVRWFGAGVTTIAPTID